MPTPSSTSSSKPSGSTPRRVVITGASRGLGLELTRQHLEEGDTVLATCRRPAEAVALQGLMKAHGERGFVAPLDVTDEASIAQAAAEAGRLLGAVDTLWSNAGIYPGSPGTDLAEGGLGTLKAPDGLAVLSANAVGAVLVAQAFLPLLRAGRSPRLAALSSGYGSLTLNRGTPYWYGASKAALNMLHRSLAFDSAAKGVVVLVLSPGWAQTDMGGAGATTPVAQAVAGLRRVVAAAELAQTGAFLDWKGASVPW